MPDTMTAAYFDALYSRDADPWGFETSAYEREKYERTMAALPRDRYAAGLEVGCSIGILTEQLARRCDRLLALDITDRALDQARARNAGHPHVTFARLSMPDERPPGTFDLVVLSEVLYFLSAPDLDRMADEVVATARPDADVVLVHWLPQTDFPLTGDEAADGFIRRASPAFRVAHQDRREQYRLDVLTRTGDGP